MPVPWVLVITVIMVIKVIEVIVVMCWSVPSLGPIIIRPLYGKVHNNVLDLPDYGGPGRGDGDGFGRETQDKDFCGVHSARHDNII